MKCPACFNALSEIKMEGIAVDVCHGGCGGVWLDAFELQRVEKIADQSSAAFRSVPRDPAVQVEPSRKRDCPRCDGIKLQRHFFSAKRRVEVDQCPSCGGYWLDAGEVESILREQAETAAAAEVSGAGISLAAIRHLYRLKTGQISKS